MTFHRIDDGTTRVMVQLDFIPEGLNELIESRGSETGAWRPTSRAPTSRRAAGGAGTA